MKNIYEPGIIKESAQGYFIVGLNDEMLTHREVECVGEINMDSVNQQSITHM